jgi:hypothetical protein
MVPIQTPSVASNDSSQRRASKLATGYSGLRAPLRKQVITQYRSRNVADASVFVDSFQEPPPDLEDQLKHMFEVSMLGDIGSIIPCPNLSGASTVQTIVSDSLLVTHNIIAVICGPPHQTTKR